MPKRRKSPESITDNGRRPNFGRGRRTGLARNGISVLPDSALSSARVVECFMASLVLSFSQRQLGAQRGPPPPRKHRLFRSPASLLCDPGEYLQGFGRCFWTERPVAN